MPVIVHVLDNLSYYFYARGFGDGFQEGIVSLISVDCLEPMYMPNGLALRQRRDGRDAFSIIAYSGKTRLHASGGTAIRWRYVLSRGSIPDRQDQLAVSKTEFDLNSTERRGEPTEDPCIQITQNKVNWVLLVKHVGANDALHHKGPCLAKASRQSPASD